MSRLTAHLVRRRLAKGTVRFRFNDIKTAQAAAHLLRLNGGAMNYMVLIKLLYLGDRQALLDHGQPITGDRLVSMKHGPVLSHVLDMIRHGSTEAPGSAWFQFVSAPAEYTVALRADAPPIDDLSPYETQLLTRVHQAYGYLGNLDRWELVRQLHEILPEWQDPGDGAVTIHHADILREDDRSEEEIAQLKGEVESAWFLESLGR